MARGEYQELPQSTGDFTRDELKKDAKLSWTDKTKAEIAAAKGENSGASNSPASGSNSGGTSSSSETPSNPSNPENPGTGGGGNTGGGDDPDDGVIS